MKNNTGTAFRIAVTVGIILACALVGVAIGSALDSARFFGQIGYTFSVVSFTGIVFAIAAAAACIVYFSDKADH